MTITETKTFDGESIDFEIYSSGDSSPDILFVHHGSSRSTYSSGSEKVADSEGFTVFSPIFPSSTYDSDEYQRGGIVDSRGNVLPQDEWTVRLEEPMVEWARNQISGDENVYLFGFSAGAQYLSRVAAYDPPEGITRIILGSPSTWVLPSLTEDAPYGFDGLGTDAEERQALQDYLALPMTIYLGSEDDDPNDSDLSTGAAAMRQGSNRLERGINTFEMGKEVAETNGWDFNWTLVIADGVGHGGSSMLKAPEMAEALHPVGLSANRLPHDIALSGSKIDETAAGGTVVGRLTAKDPDGDQITFSVTGDSRFAVKGSDLVVAAGADLNGDGDRKVNLTVSASDGHGGAVKAGFAVTINDFVDPDLGTADHFRFSGNNGKGTTVSHIDDLNFDEGDTLSFFGYAKGTFRKEAFWKNSTWAEVESLSELKALDQMSKAISLTSNKNAELIIKIYQNHALHKIVVHELDARLIDARLPVLRVARASTGARVITLSGYGAGPCRRPPRPAGGAAGASGHWRVLAGKLPAGRRWPSAAAEVFVGALAVDAASSPGGLRIRLASPGNRAMATIAYSAGLSDSGGVSRGSAHLRQTSCVERSGATFARVDRAPVRSYGE